MYKQATNVLSRMLRNQSCFLVLWFTS